MFLAIDVAETRMAPANPDPDLLRRARDMYADASMTVPRIAAALQMSETTLYKMRREQDWPRRKPARPASKPSRKRKSGSKQPKSKPMAGVSAGQALACETPGAEIDSAQLEKRLAHAVSRELSNFEVGEDEAASRSDRNARILSSLAKTLAELRKLESAPARRKTRQGSSPHGQTERPPRDLATLREALARKIEEFQRSRSAS